MPIINKTKNTAAIFNRGREVVKVYDHGKLAWQKSIPDYLCFTALEAGTFTLTIPAALSTNANSRLSYIEWSKDGRNWNRTENKNSTEITIPVDVVTGDKVYWRGSGTSMTSASVALTSDCRFTSTARFNASGHLLSLLKLDDYDATTGWASATFANLFYQAATLIDASGIILPALAAGNAYTFYGTFYECTNLVAAPDFNTSYTGNFMCFQMYRGCTSLTTMPKLPTTLSTSIFSGMFRGCTSLAITQPLNYSTLAENCFANMFNGCSSLSYVKCLATDISANGCLTNWLYGVSSTGTFIQASGVEWPRGASGIPTGWLAYDEGEQIPNDYTPCDYIHITKGSGMVADVLADKSTYGCELEYNFTQNELDAAANNNTYIPLMYYSKAVTTDPDFPKQICGQLYLRYNANWLGWQRNAGIYIRPTTGEKTTNSSAIVMKRPAVTGWHYIRCAATTTDDDFICLFDDEISQTGINYYRLMNENPTDEPAEIYISCRSASAAYPIDNGGDMKYFKIIHPDGETIVADYVPCVRKSDNVAGFWDKVGLVFKSSFRTPFVAGYNQT